MTEIYDNENHFTGEYKLLYNPPELAYGNISPARGDVYTSPFGLTEGIDKVIVLEDPEFPIYEDSVLWIDRDPLGRQYDYTVVRIARSLNSISIAVKKVDVTNGTSSNNSSA
jgi:hypothetical protein